MLVHVDNRMCAHIEYRRIAFPYGKATAGSFFNVLCGLMLLRTRFLTICSPGRLLSLETTQEGPTHTETHSLPESQVIGRLVLCIVLAVFHPAMKPNLWTDARLELTSHAKAK